MSNPLHQTLMHTIKGKTLAYIVNVIPIMSEREVWLRDGAQQTHGRRVWHVKEK